MTDAPDIVERCAWCGEPLERKSYLIGGRPHHERCALRRFNNDAAELTTLRTDLAAAQAEVSRLEERIAELYRAEKNSFLSLTANGQLIERQSADLAAAQAELARVRGISEEGIAALVCDAYCDLQKQGNQCRAREAATAISRLIKGDSQCPVR